MRHVALAITMAAASTIALGQAPTRPRAYSARGFGLSVEGGWMNLSAGPLTRRQDAASGGSGASGIAGGVGLRYGFTPQLAAIFDLVVVDVRGGEALSGLLDSSWGFYHADIGLRYHMLGNGRRWVPFVDAAYSPLELVSQNEGPGLLGAMVDTTITLSGSGITVGGGVLVFLREKWALSGTGTWTRGEFDDIDKCTGVSSCSGLVPQKVNSFRLGLGLAWFPGNRVRSL